jgi:hypothetical protein
MSWTSLSDFELIKAEVALCEGASHAIMSIIVGLILNMQTMSLNTIFDLVSQ